jgi:hypothetical protein
MVMLPRFCPATVLDCYRILLFLESKILHMRFVRLDTLLQIHGEVLHGPVHIKILVSSQICVSKS